MVSPSPTRVFANFHSPNMGRKRPNGWKSEAQSLQYWSVMNYPRRLVPLFIVAWLAKPCTVFTRMVGILCLACDKIIVVRIFPRSKVPWKSRQSLRTLVSKWHQVNVRGCCMLDYFSPQIRSFTLENGLLCLGIWVSVSLSRIDQRDCKPNERIFFRIP